MDISIQKIHAREWWIYIDGKYVTKYKSKRAAYLGVASGLKKLSKRKTK